MPLNWAPQLGLYWKTRISRSEDLRAVLLVCAPKSCYLEKYVNPCGNFYVLQFYRVFVFLANKT